MFTSNTEYTGGSKSCFRSILAILLISADGGYCFTPCVTVNKITQKLIDGFLKSLRDQKAVNQGQIDSILVKIC